MKRLILTAIIWSGATTLCLGQYEPTAGQTAYYAPAPASCNAPNVSCDTPARYPNPNCNAPEPNCNAPNYPSTSCAAPELQCCNREKYCHPQQCCKPCCQPQSPTQPPRAPQEQPPQGYFAAPPQNGTVAGGSNTVAVEGLALHFPSLTLKLPSLQLPTLTRMRTPPRMYVDQAQAPYVPYSSAPASAPFAVHRMPENNPSNAPNSPENNPQKSPGNCSSPAPNCAAPSPSCNAPSPNCNAQLEQRIQEREEQIARLEQQMLRLSNTMERFIDQSNQMPRPVRVQPVHYEEPALLQTADANLAPLQAVNGELRRLPPVLDMRSSATYR